MVFLPMLSHIRYPAATSRCAAGLGEWQDFLATIGGEVTRKGCAFGFVWQGSLNYPFWENETMQRYGQFVGNVMIPFWIAVKTGLLGSFQFMVISTAKSTSTFLFKPKNPTVVIHFCLLFHECCLIFYKTGGFKHFLFSPLPGEEIVAYLNQVPPSFRSPVPIFHEEWTSWIYYAPGGLHTLSKLLLLGCPRKLVRG